MTITFDVLGYADFMGRIKKSRMTPGLAAFSHTVEKVRRENPEGTLLLNSGDEWTINFWGGIPVVEGLNILGTDAMTLGNHEFDWGNEFLEKCVAAANFPVLCANIHYKKTGEPIKGTVPYTILERQGVKIGILGLVTEYTPYMVEKSAFEPFTVSSAAEAGQRYIPEMREQGAEIIIVVAHFPFYIEDDNSISGELWEVMQEIPPIDVFIGGHIPGDYGNVINDTCILKAGFLEASLGRARLVFDTKLRQVVKRSCQVLATDREAEGMPEIREHVAKATEPFIEYLTEPLAKVPETWRMTLARESKLGNFLADSLRFGGQTELAYMNATSAGGYLEKGAVTREAIIDVTRFNDPICVGEITGEQLYQLMEMVYEPHRFGNNAGILISGFHAVIDHTKSSPHKIVKLTLPDGTLIERDRTYSVTTSTYMASGGNDTSRVAKEIDFKQTDLRFHDAAFNYAKSLGVLEIADWPRFQETGTPENDNSPF